MSDDIRRRSALPCAQSYSSGPLGRIDAADIVKLNGDIAAILQGQEVSERLSRLGAEPMPPEAFDAYLRSELASLAPIMKASGIRPD